MPKILMVEDDKDLAMIVHDWLKAEFYALDVVHDGRVGYEYLQRGDYDLIILDWDLPGMPGVELCRKWRGEGGRTPILILTGKGQIEEKEEGLDAGADDYLTKPFTMRELSARLRALLRRPATKVSHILKIGNLEMDPSKHILSKNGEFLHLPRKDFDLLEYLMRNPGRFFSIDHLLERIWSFDTEATSDAVRTAIKRLRKALDDGDDENDSMIESARRVGYRLRDVE
jgi:two-component system, OmpR family, response regulator